MERTPHRFGITRIQLRNIRGFQELDLDLRANQAREGSLEIDLPRKTTLIIGKNGTCKTSLLRAIAMGLADATDANRLISEPIGGLVSEQADTGNITIQGFDYIATPLEITLSKILVRQGDREGIFPDKQGGLRTAFLGEPLPFVCGYGAGRFGVSTSIPDRSYRIADSTYSLFNYKQTLIDPELTLRRLRDYFSSDIYDRTLRGIKRALGLTAEDQIDLRLGGGVEISGPSVGEQIVLEGWADGYRMTFSWILDLYAWAMRAEAIDKDGNIEGILLVDEIDQHLHPSMQAEILPRLSELLPKMQIFATTHSPLVALDAKPEELVVLRREGDHVVAEQRVPDFSGYSAEDMLSDPRLFNTEVYGSETREKLSEYRKLASIPKEERSPEERRKLRALATKINSFETPQERESETSRLLKELMAKFGLGPPTGQQHPPSQESGGEVVIKKASSDMSPPKVAPDRPKEEPVGTSPSVGGGAMLRGKMIFLNGIDGSTGKYLSPPMTAAQVGVALGIKRLGQRG